MIIWEFSFETDIEYGAVYWDPYREGQLSPLNRVQKRAAKFANNINGSGWETSAQRRLIARPNMRPFQGIDRGTGLESDRVIDF
jgi:hypothetical protein